MDRNFVYAAQVASLTNGVAQGKNDTQNSTSVDRLGFDEVSFTVQLGASDASSAGSVKLQHSDDNSAWADVEASSQSFDNTAANKLIRIGLFRPRKRYVRVAVIRANSGTSGTAITAIHGVLRLPNSQPVAQHSTVYASKQIANRDTGTA